MSYELTWVTENLAVGWAPMSYDDLDLIREGGVDAIVNLCREYCDLHEIEMQSGFTVYYFPIEDECAPDLEELEKAIEWVDLQMADGKKVLVHCRFGIGRTGTFVTAYLLRQGRPLKEVTKLLKKTRANPMNHCQIRFVKQYDKKLKTEEA